jgi:hypothetical protein
MIAPPHRRRVPAAASGSGEGMNRRLGSGVEVTGTNGPVSPAGRNLGRPATDFEAFPARTRTARADSSAPTSPLGPFGSGVRGRSRP